MRWIGIDVGGANIKVSDGTTYARSLPFELWRQPDRLTAAIEQALAAAPSFEAVAATMTGELADCFETKAEGVRHIANALLAAAHKRRVAIYCVDGCFNDVASIRHDPLPAAASNWHALARYASEYLPGGTGIVIDVGSTTADIVPVQAHRVATSSRTDTQRLIAGELVYAGAQRTPICSLAAELPYRDSDCPTAAEVFATTADVYHLLGMQSASDTSTADGRSMSDQYAVDRLARQLCADRHTFNIDDARTAAQFIYERQLSILEKALHRVAAGMATSSIHAVTSGSGEFLAGELVERSEATHSAVSLSEQVGTDQSCCAAAAAVARLAAMGTG